MIIERRKFYAVKSCQTGCRKVKKAEKQVIDRGALCRQLAMRQPWRLFGKCLNGWVNFTFPQEKHLTKHFLAIQRSLRVFFYATVKFPSRYSRLLLPKSVFICCYVGLCATFPALKVRFFHSCVTGFWPHVTRFQVLCSLRNSRFYYGRSFVWNLWHFQSMLLSNSTRKMRISLELYVLPKTFSWFYFDLFNP